MPKAVVSPMTPSSPESYVQPRRAVGEVARTSSGSGSETVRQCQGRRTRGPTCRWTAELDATLAAAWHEGGARAGRRALKKVQPSWSWSAVRKHAASLGLCTPKPPRWTQSEVDQLLWSIDSNASLALIAKRLGRSVGAVRKRLWDLGYKAESLGGYKVKELAEMLAVTPARVQYWVDEDLLFTKGGRITESSLTKFLSEHPQRVPFNTLPRGMQDWLGEMGYPQETPESALVVAGATELVSVGGVEPVGES